EAHAGFHNPEGIQLIIHGALFDDRREIFAFFFLSQVSQGLDNAVGSICGYVRPVYSENIGKSSRHDRSIYLIGVTAAAVISRHELDVCKILSVISLVKSFY